MKKDFVYFLIPSCFVFLFAYLLQNHIYVSNDVSYLVYVTEQLLAGGTYAHDFFETNPPMILYLYLPICITAHFFHVNILTVTQYYVFILASISTIVAFYLLKKILRNEDRQLSLYSLSFAIACVLLLFPANQFGQREHLFMIFMLPYLFTSLLAFQDRKIKPLIAFFIGILAGFGFAMKPFFLIPLLFVETYYILTKKSIWFFFRSETIAICGILILYLASIFILQPSYIFTMLPIIMDLYFESAKEPWFEILTTSTLYYCATAIVAYFIFQIDERDQPLMRVLLLSMIGMMIAAIIPRTPWYYHMLPAYGFACLIWTYYLIRLSSFSLANGKSTINKILILPLGLILFSMPISDTISLYQFYMYNKSRGPKHRLIQYVSSLPKHDTVSCFSFNTTDDCFPLVYYTHSKYGGRFPFFWWLRAILRFEHFPKQDKLPETFAKEKEYVFAETIKDLDHYKNDVIIINIDNIGLLFDKRFDFIKYFSQDERFRKTWGNYQYLTTIAQYQVYQRVTEV